MKYTGLNLFLLLGVCNLAVAKMSPEQIAKLPPPAAGKVNFTKDIKPIIEASCIKCHGRGRSKGDFRLDTRDTLLKGGESGAAVVVGKSQESSFIELVAGVDPANVMPQKGSRLTAEQIGLLRGWIDQGVPWDSEVTFAKVIPVNLTPKFPVLPAASKALSNPVDRLLQSHYKSIQFKTPPLVDDRVFARRVYLDAIGLLPTPEELDAFLRDKRPDKRTRLVQQLLADNRRYAEHWLTFWNDALRNDYRGTGYIDGGRKQITKWLFSALLNNLPYDQFVAQLINPTEESAGFTKGIVWRGAVNASQVPPMQAAQNISQVFMGVNLKCASCHDSFINDWTLADSYALANIYSDQPLELFQCDKPTGKKAGLKFIFPELGDIDPKADKATRLKRLAEIITDKKDGRLSRTIVNRLWAKFLGRGLVDPVDEMDNPAWNPDLLDWLAEDLVANGYDLKKTMERILTSQAYQLPAVSFDERSSKAATFRGPLVRRMTAEQFRDSLAELTGIWFKQPAGEFDFSESGKSAAAEFAGRAQWIWNDVRAAQKAPPGTVYWRKIVSLKELPNEAAALVACDNSFTLYVNGKNVATGKDFKAPVAVDLLPHLRKGENVLALAAVNNLPDNTPPVVGKPIPANSDSPAGLYFQARVRAKDAMLDFGSDSSWRWSVEKKDNWEKLEFVGSDWKPGVELGDVGMAPWNASKNLAQAAASLHSKEKARAALVNADALMVSLGRPNREVVITSRPSAATTLQALELTNGETLAKLLQQATAKLIVRKPGFVASDLVIQLFQQALGRKPTAAEFKLSLELVGEPANKEGVEDLLWSLAMLPEFQLIY